VGTTFQSATADLKDVAIRRATARESPQLFQKIDIRFFHLVFMMIAPVQYAPK
jgi:hypothetical protein